MGKPLVATDIADTCAGLSQRILASVLLFPKSSFPFSNEHELNVNSDSTCLMICVGPGFNSEELQNQKEDKVRTGIVAHTLIPARQRGLWVVRG